MNEQVPYSFTILRYVHDVVAGEFLNVGVVMHAPTGGGLLVRTQTLIGRLRHTFPEIDLHAFRDMMRSIENGILGLSEQLARTPLIDSRLDARKYAQRVLPHDDSAYQWSPPGWGLTADVPRTMEQLFARYVTRHDKQPEHGGPKLTEAVIGRTFQKRLRDLGADVPFERKHVRGKEDEITFETAWKNGRWHAYEPVSLDLANEQGIKDKARRWRGHLSAVCEGASDEVSLYFLVGRPRDASLASAYDCAKVILAGSPFGPEVVDEEESGSLAERVKEEYLLSIEG